MLIIGCDFHARYRQIAMLDDGTGEIVERRLEHESGEADRFCRGLPNPVRVGVEATGPLHWFCGHALSLMSILFLAGLASRVICLMLVGRMGR